MAFKLVILSCLLAFASARNVQELIVENYVIGGHETKPGEFPHQVSLQWGFDRVTAEHFCGGSIIHRQWILTAAHCIESIPFYGTFFIRAGKHNLTKFEKEEFEADIYDAYVHPLFIGGAAPFDIALIKLRTPLKLTKRINIAKLPKRFEETTGVKVLAGWGAKDTAATSPRISDVLQKVSLPIMDIKACNETIIKLAQPDTSPLHWTNLCTAPVETGDGACMSDAGSALIDPRDDGDKIVGLVSWGFVPCGSNKSPSIFVKVSDFVDWINETIISNS